MEDLLVTSQATEAISSDVDIKLDGFNEDSSIDPPATLPTTINQSGITSTTINQSDIPTTTQLTTQPVAIATENSITQPITFHVPPTTDSTTTRHAAETTSTTMQGTFIEQENEDRLENKPKAEIDSMETPEVGDRAGKNPFTQSGKLSRKADYILSRSTITRTNLRISDPDLPSNQPITHQQETEVLLVKQEAASNGHAGNVVEVTCVKVESPETDCAETVKLSKNNCSCGRCCGCCCGRCCGCCCGRCRCCRGCCERCRAACSIQ